MACYSILHHLITKSRGHVLQINKLFVYIFGATSKFNVLALYYFSLVGTLATSAKPRDTQLRKIQITVVLNIFQICIEEVCVRVIRQLFSLLLETF